MRALYIIGVMSLVRRLFHFNQSINGGDGCRFLQAPMCLYIRIILSTLYSYSNQPNNY